MLELRQSACTSIKMRACFVKRTDGKLECASHWDVHAINGRTYAYDQSGLVITQERNPLAIRLPAHGLCKFLAFKLALDSHGNMTDTTKVFGCEDGFAGDSVVPWKRIKN